MFIKKAALIGTSIALSTALLTGCGGGSGSGGGNSAGNQGNTGNKNQGSGSTTAYVPKQLTVQFVPSQNAETLEAKAKPLEKLLSDKLGIPVKVTVSTNYNTIIEAMSSKKIDVGFLPPTAYVLAKQRGAAEVILQSQRFGVIQPGGLPDKTKLVDFYRSMILVKKDSGIKDLKDLKGKKIAWQDVTSSAGYVWPAVEMKKAGIDPEKDVQGITVKGHDKGVLAVLNGDVDAAAVFEDARNTVKKDKPDIFNKVVPLYFTQPIPNDTVSVRADMDPEWQKKIQQAFIDIAKEGEGKKIVKEIYSIEGFAPSTDKNFDIVREYNKEVGQ